MCGHAFRRKAPATVASFLHTFLMTPAPRAIMVFLVTLLNINTRLGIRLWNFPPCTEAYVMRRVRALALGLYFLVLII